MEKIKLFAKKLKSFTLDDIVVLSEINEEEVISILNKLIEDKIILKKNLVYVYNETQNRNKKTDKKVTKQVEKPQKLVKPRSYRQLKKSILYTFDERKSELLQKINKFDSNIKITQKDRKLWNSATKSRRDKAERWVKILKETTGLYGHRLKEYVAKYNEKNPDNKTSAGNIFNKRRLIQTYGVNSLIGIYDIPKKAEKREVYYLFFEKLYLSPCRFNYKQCIEEVAKYFEVNINQRFIKFIFKKVMEHS